MQGVAQWWLAI